ncbi:MAG TPA: molybdopterin-dependent oxidoreductase, partial [Burkholderiaceae bacterium]
LKTPMIKQGGQWQPASWDAALRYVADGLQRVKAEHGAAGIAALGSPHSTLEELHLLAKLVRGLGSENIDHRLRHSDFASRAPDGSARWLGLPIAALSSLERVFVVGSFLRKDHPLFASRIRQAVRRGAKLMSLHAVHDDWAVPVAQRITAAPSAWIQALADIATAVAQHKGVSAPAAGEAHDAAKAIAEQLLSGERKAVLLGNAAVQHPQASMLLALAHWIASQCGASIGMFGEAANSVGAQWARVLPGPSGLHAGQMLSQPMKALLLLNVEPVHDAADPAAARAALEGSGLVVALTPFLDAAVDNADVLLPIAPFSETAGTFVNAEGRAQSFHGVVKGYGESRPAWKVLRVLANLLGLPGFDYQDSEAVRDEVLAGADAATRLSNQPTAVPPAQPPALRGLERVADVPIYCTDALVRRSAPLQATRDAQAPVVGLPSVLWSQLGLSAGAKVRVAQGEAAAILPAEESPSLAPTAVRIAAGHAHTASLGAMFGAVTVEKA